MKVIEIFKSLTNVIGTTIGVVLIAIGAVMLINATLKLTVFGLDSGPHHNIYGCDLYEEDSRMRAADEKLAIDLLSEEERLLKYEECLVREQEREKKRFINTKKHSLVDGIALLIVGIPLFAYYMRRSKKS